MATTDGSSTEDSATSHQEQQEEQAVITIYHDSTSVRALGIGASNEELRARGEKWAAVQQSLKVMRPCVSALVFCFRSVALMFGNGSLVCRLDCRSGSVLHCFFTVSLMAPVAQQRGRRERENKV